MTHSFWQRRASRTHRHADVCVVGGGIAGVSVAYWLRRLAPGRRVMLVEAGRLASKASGRNAGFLLPGADPVSAEALGPERAARVWQFSLENEREVVETFGAACDFQPTGHLAAAGDEAEAEALASLAADLVRRGAAPEGSLRVLDGAETDRASGGEGFAGGLHIGTGGTLDPVRLVQAIAAASSADVLEHEPVQALEPSAGGIRVVTAGQVVEAPQVVLALNAFLPSLVPELSAHVQPVRAQMLATTPAPHTLVQPIYSHTGHFYTRQLPDGTVLCGGARHLYEQEEVGLGDRTTGGLQRALEGYLAYHFPALGPLNVQQRWSGPMGFSPDGLPSVGRVPGIEGALWVGGFTGHGMSLGVRMGRLVADRLLDCEDPYADLFDAERLLLASG